MKRKIVLHLTMREAEAVRYCISSATAAEMQGYEDRPNLENLIRDASESVLYKIQESGYVQLNPPKEDAPREYYEGIY